jgi:hypothetical protein
VIPDLYLPLVALVLVGLTAVTVTFGSLERPRPRAGAGSSSSASPNACSHMLFGVLDRLLDFAFGFGLDGCPGSLSSSASEAGVLDRAGFAFAFGLGALERERLVSELISNTSGSAFCLPCDVKLLLQLFAGAFRMFFLFVSRARSRTAGRPAFLRSSARRSALSL